MGLTTTDLNADGRPDLVVAINNHRMIAFENTGVSQHRVFNVRLRGKPGNTTAAGARVLTTASNWCKSCTRAAAICPSQPARCPTGRADSHGSSR